jgi:predicted enzyme related to lactoylglutathione lyase
MKHFEPSAIAHLDISGPDFASLSDFYGAVFDWNIAPKGEGYSLIGTPGGGPDAALVEAEGASVVVGIAVADIAASIAVALERGGTEIMPPTDNGWVVKAQIRDPAGNLLTLIQNG